MYSLKWHLNDIVVDDLATTEKINPDEQIITGTDNVDHKALNAQKASFPPKPHATITNEWRHSDITESSIVVDANGVESLDSNSSSSSEGTKIADRMRNEGLKDSISYNLAHSQDNEMIPGGIFNCNENDQLKESNDILLSKISNKTARHTGKYVLLNILNS